MTATISRRARRSTESRTDAVIYLRVSTKEQAERGGDAEGYSIPAQREACTRKAADLGLSVAAQFIDAGESARSAARPELQRMLTYLAENPVSAVIVHKVDRLARNRADDVQITLAIQASGAKLVSVTENIDDTPQGKLMHTIFSGLAAFYSDNLATEVIKGTQQKVLAGGTPMMAPIGYLNAPASLDDQNNRIVIIDPVRGELIAWAFTVYATGDWTLTSLAHELTVRGLRKRATRTRAAEPVSAKQLQIVLRNPYYMGIVTWQGMEYDGKHPTLVTPEIFEQVQNVLTAHRQSGERSYRRKHYLAGTVYCDLCDSKLIYMLSRGRAGEKYGYWACLGRHTYKNGCQLPYLPDEVVEDKIIEQWRQERLTDADAAQLRNGLLADLADYTHTTTDEADRLDKRIDAIQRERRKWAEKAMDDTVPDDIARDKQRDLGQQLATAQTQRAKLQATTTTHETALGYATDLITHCDEAYRRSPEPLRRDYNQAWFDRLCFRTENGQPVIADVQRTEWAAALHTAQIHQPDVDQTIDTPHDRNVFEQVLDTATPDNLETTRTGPKEKPGTFRYRVTSCVRGSNVATLVGDTGIEPVTPTVSR